MRRIDKEIAKRDAEGNLIGACTIAKRAGYYFEVRDGDGENGMCEPTLLCFGRTFPSDDEDYCNINF